MLEVNRTRLVHVERASVATTPHATRYCLSVEFMGTHQIPILRLQTEILIRIFSLFDPLTDIRLLRQVIAACNGTEAQRICDITECILQNQRDELLKAWRELRAESLASSISAGDKVLDGIAEELIGKQYVRDSEDIDGDHWVTWPRE